MAHPWKYKAAEEFLIAQKEMLLMYKAKHFNWPVFHLLKTRLKSVYKSQYFGWSYFAFNITLSQFSEVHCSTGLQEYRMAYPSILEKVPPFFCFPWLSHLLITSCRSFR